MLYLVVPLAVLIGVIWALVVFPSFRVVAVILVALSTVVYFWANEKAAQQKKDEAAQKERERVAFDAEQRSYCQAEQKRWTIVSASQVELRGASLKQAPFYGVINESYGLTASVKNKSKFKVTALRLSVTALDCPTQDAKATDCEIIGRGAGTFDAEIPPGEARQITGKVTLANIATPRGVFSPRFAVSGVRAPIDQADDAPANDLLGNWLYKCN